MLKIYLAFVMLSISFYFLLGITRNVNYLKRLVQMRQVGPQVLSHSEAEHNNNQKIKCPKYLTP